MGLVDIRPPGLPNEIKVEPHSTILPEYNRKEIQDLPQYKVLGRQWKRREGNVF